MGGLKPFVDESVKLAYGEGSAELAEGRVAAIQSLSGTGSCRLMADFMHRFKPDAKIPLQAFGNSLGFASGENLPTHASVANDSDGYRQEALLFVDEQWADTAAARGAMSSLLWRPVVKFVTTHYQYVKDHTGLPRLLQRNVGAADESPMTHFYQPAGDPQRPPLSANPAATPATPPSPPLPT